MMLGVLHALLQRIFKSLMKSQKSLTFNSLRKVLSHCLNQLPDKRQALKCDYSIHDAVMCGFACMYFQDPSLLHFEKQLRDEENRDNLMNLLDVQKIPESTQTRDLIDNVSSHQFNSVLKEYFSRLHESKHLYSYELFPGLYICSIDGTGYFSSGTIHCESCLTQKHDNGDITYSHKVLQAAIMHPDMRQVIPLMPEQICNTDGSTKQDCETNAGKRAVVKIRKDHPGLGLIIVGDDLFSKQPFIEALRREGMHYILIAKASDHVVMTRHINALDQLHQKYLSDEKGRTHLYEWTHKVPLNGNANPIITNFFRYTMTSIDKNGKEKINYRNSWVTDLEITQSNIATLVKGGRCKWKIENECFNTLKNQGYNIEHNYGHGKKNLCFNFYLLTLLAFFFHQIFELTDRLYKACREKFGSKTHMWETLRSYIRIHIFESWQMLLDFALTPKKYKPSLVKPP